jgi:hypothetical protein
MDDYVYDFDWEIEQILLTIEYFEESIENNRSMNEFEYYETLRKIHELESKVENLQWAKKRRLIYCDH